MTFVVIGFAVFVANHLYEEVTDKNWKRAADRTWFQWAAIFVCWLAAG